MHLAPIICPRVEGDLTPFYRKFINCIQKHCKIQYGSKANLSPKSCSDFFRIERKLEIANKMQKYEDMIDHCSYTDNLRSCEIKAYKKISGLNGIRTHDLCDTGEVLY